MAADSAGRVSRRAALAAMLGLGAAACSRLAFVAANVPAAFGSYRRHADIAYGRNSKHRLDIYVPDAPPVSPRPLVVFWYGGRWETGDGWDERP